VPPSFRFCTPSRYFLPSLFGTAPRFPCLEHSSACPSLPWTIAARSLPPLRTALRREIAFLSEKLRFTFVLPLFHSFLAAKPPPPVVPRYSWLQIAGPFRSLRIIDFLQTLRPAFRSPAESLLTLFLAGTLPASGRPAPPPLSIRKSRTLRQSLRPRRP